MRNRSILLADVCLIPIVAYAAFALRFEWRFYTTRHEFLSYVVAAVLIKPIVFHLFGMYRRYWRYASVKDLMAVLLAASASFIALGIFVACALVYNPLFEFSRSVLLLDGLLTFLAVGGVRMSVRVVGESRQTAREPQRGAAGKRVLVVGAGQAGTMVVREMDRNPHLGMTPVGFLDDDRAKLGKQMYGLTTRSLRCRPLRATCCGRSRNNVAGLAWRRGRARGVRAAGRERQRQPSPPDRDLRPAEARPTAGHPCRRAVRARANEGQAR